MEQKTSLSKRKAKRQIKVKDNKVETVSSPETKKPARRKIKFYSFIVVMLILNGIVYSYWLTGIFDDAPKTPTTLAKNLSNPNKKVKSELPPDFDLPPQNAPIDRGYNASSGQFPPGALPPGVSLPGITSYNPTTQERTMAQGYGVNDGIRQQFTGQQRDMESNLDYFNARYYSSQHGRFTSVDPENAGADPSDPQSWNAYAYARNNPLKYTDPDGEKWKVCDNQGNCTEISDLDAKNTLFNRRGNHPEIIRKDGKIFDEDGNPSGTYERISFDDFDDRQNALFFGPNSIGEQSKTKAKVVGGLAAGAVVVGACIGTGTCAAVAAGTAALLKKSLSYSTKIARQMPKRGWTKSQVEETIKNASTTAKTTFKETGNSATAYINKDGSYVVVENATQKIIQISDKTRPWDFPKDWIWK